MQPTLWTQEQTELTSDDYYTPRWLFDALNVTFDLDVASPPGGPPYVPTRAYYTQKDDGLTAPWHGLVWMNPPYSKTRPWVERFLEHNNGIALTLVANSIWCRNLWNAKTTVCWFDDFKFVQGSTGKLVKIGFTGVYLWGIGQGTTIMKNSTLKGIRTNG